jgi:hypothetical protein
MGAADGQRKVWLRTLARTSSPAWIAAGGVLSRAWPLGEYLIEVARLRHLSCRRFRLFDLGGGF